MTENCLYKCFRPLYLQISVLFIDDELKSIIQKALDNEIDIITLNIIINPATMCRGQLTFMLLN